MSPKFRFAAAMLAAVLVAAWSTAASAQRWAKFPLSGNARAQIGDGLPIPIGFTQPPTGRVEAVDNARIRQTLTGPSPRPLELPEGQFFHPASSRNLPVFGANSAVFQVKTNISLELPGHASVLFSAGGRTGGSVVSFCPGQTIPTTGAMNPGCGLPDDGTPINGRLRYTATSNQFGGPAQARVGGTATVWLRAPGGAPAPCDYNVNAQCLAAIAKASPAGTGAVGAPFGFSLMTSPGVTTPGVFQVNVAAAGTILSFTPTPASNPGPTNAATSFGGPYTTGMLVVSVTSTIGGGTEAFSLTGSDNRSNGIGTISLVAGAVSDRGISGENANRGWLNMTISGQRAPTLSGWGIAALSLLLTGVAVWMMRRTTASATS